MTMPFPGVRPSPLSAPGESLAKILLRSRFIHVPTTSGWTTTLVGSGGVTQVPGYLRATSDTTASSSALATVGLWGSFSKAGSSWQLVNWGKKIYMYFHVMRSSSDAEMVGRIQLKQVTTIGALGAKGIGFRTDNLAMVGESYGTALGALDLSTTMVDGEQYRVVIVHDPLVPSIQWWVDGVLKGTQTTANTIPSGVGTAAATLAVSSANGVTGGVNAFVDTANYLFWQQQ